MSDCTKIQCTAASSIEELLDSCPKNQTIGDNLVRAWFIINKPYHNIACCLSGGADSDVALDICHRCDKDNKIRYINFDTGLEYQATRTHLRELEKRYNIKIERYSPKKPVPTVCRQYGQPFLSKQVSEFIYRLQRHNFRFEDEPYEVLIRRYPRCQSALDWWCNRKRSNKLNICNNRYLKEFLIANPPEFPISDKCCEYAKLRPMADLNKKESFDLQVIGTRKAEGGARAVRNHSCFSEKQGGIDTYRPVFWYQNQDRECYEEHYGIGHSVCYTSYGLKRTGCAGCPFGRDFEYELQVLKEHEPNLYKAVCNIFGKSYDYTRRYRAFCKEMKKKGEGKKVPD